MRFRRRLILLYAVFAACLALIWLRTVQMQMVDGDYWAARAQKARQITRVLEAPRGPIYDANGVVLARDEATLQLAMVPWAFERRRRVHCRACDATTYLRSIPDKKGRMGRVPKKCACRRAKRHEFASLEPMAIDEKTLEVLPPGDLRPLEDALGVPHGTLAKRASDRLHEIGGIVTKVVDLMESRGELEFFRTDHEESIEADLKRRPVVLETGIPDAAARMILLDEHGTFRGFRIQTDLRRYYPEADCVPRVLGFVTKVSSEQEYRELRKDHGAGSITRNSRVGRSGIERGYNWHLHGRPGSETVTRDENGSFTDVVERKPPVPGSALHLSLDVEACRRAEVMLRKYATREKYFPNARPSAGFVMMDAENGQILVWGETPNFDLNTELDELYDAKLTNVRADRVNRTWLPIAELPDGMDLEMFRDRVDAPAPLALSRVSQIACEPGSTFKPLIALGLLSTGHLTTHHRFACGSNRSYKPGCHACGQVDLVMALIRSCNRYFAWYMRDNDKQSWEARRRHMGAFMQSLGFGVKPNKNFREWSGGKWGDDAIDFAVADSVETIRKRWATEIEFEREQAARAGLPAPASPPKISLVFGNGCPDVCAGRSKSFERRLYDVVRRVAQASAAETIELRVGLEESTEKRVQLRIRARALGAPRWTHLPGAALEDLPKYWRRDMASERLGILGNPARGGSIWFRARFDKATGRKRREDHPVIHAHDGRNVAIGQGPVLTTPLQMVRAVAAIANGGMLVTPQVVAKIGNHPRHEPREQLPVSAVHLQAIREGMFGVIEHPRGTAHGKGFEQVNATVYGKTGTAQLGGNWKPWASDTGDDGAWHHWFVGFAEAPGRRTVAFACVMHARREAGAGMTAGRAVAEILRDWFDK